MIVKDKKTKEWSGVLIDWDMSLLWMKHEGEPRTRRTGTWPFISAKILSSPHSVAHTLWDDLESAFWVLIYQALRYLNHNYDPNPLFVLLEQLFDERVTVANGSVTAGDSKMTIMAFCAYGRDHRKLPRFRANGLNRALQQLGTIFDFRYGDTEPAPEEPDQTRIPDLLRQAAMAMEPLSITPTGLVSPTNNSKPPTDPEDWQRVKIEDVEKYLDPMSWSSGPKESAKVQEGQISRVDSSMIHDSDGSSMSKRSYKSDPEDEEGPLLKKQRQVPPT
ncbi:hypothetical protein B0H34DRAFT_803115 [Crassisporium funariophilum]|nr:hypothetical protein B0H34DRAFT_803115 [Crassisporium funariophilum]